MPTNGAEERRACISLSRTRLPTCRDIWPRRCRVNKGKTQIDWMSATVSITTAQCDDDIRAILALQQTNLMRNTSTEMQNSDGFVTIQYEYDALRKINSTMPSVIAKDASGNLIGYTLAIPPEFVATLPALGSLFTLIESLQYEGKPIQDHAYYVMGQSCVAFGFRGQQVLARMLHKHRELYKDRSRLLITSISQKNPRSLRAHLSAGFERFKSFHDPLLDDTWYMIMWDWHKQPSS